MSYVKLSMLTIVAVFLLAPCGQAAMPNLVQNPRFMTAPPADGNFVAADWQYSTVYTTATAVTTRLAPGLRFETVNGPAGTSTTDRGAWQAIPVVPGARYQVNASWRGHFNSDGATTNSGAATRVYVAFGTGSTGPWTSEQHLLYKKFGYNRQIDSWNVPMSLFVPSNGTTYSFLTFENANLSPATNHPIVQDIALAPASSTYMRLRLNFSSTSLPAQSATLPGGGQSWVEIDNVSVAPCQGALVGDSDGDCDVDVRDFGRFVATWLVCGNSSNNTLCW
jgi:hypothetical protein